MTTTSTTQQFARHPAKRLTLHLSMRDHVHHGSLMIAVLKRAKRANLAGATVFEGQKGYGESGHVHRQHVLSDDSPITVVIVDLPQRIDAFLAEIEDLLVDVLVTLEPIDVVEI